MTAEEPVPSPLFRQKTWAGRVASAVLQPSPLRLSVPPPTSPPTIRIRDFLTASDAASLRFFATDYCGKLVKRPASASGLLPSFLSFFPNFFFSPSLQHRFFPCSRHILHPISSLYSRVWKKKRTGRRRWLKDNFARTRVCNTRLSSFELGSRTWITMRLLFLSSDETDLYIVQQQENPCLWAT